MSLFERKNGQAVTGRKFRAGSLLWLMINLLLNLRRSIPAWILLALHFWLGISIWWFVGGLAFWILSVWAEMWFVGWAASCANEKDPPKENKNPYSVRKDRDSTH